MSDFGPVYDDFGVPMNEPLDLRPMTDLDAIRARDAAWTDQYLVAPDGFQSAHDRRALLAEVDRLRAVRLEASESHVWLEGAATERARIRAAVEGLPTQPGLEVNIPGMRHFIERTAVLAAIDGEDPK